MTACDKKRCNRLFLISLLLITVIAVWEAWREWGPVSQTPVRPPPSPVSVESIPVAVTELPPSTPPKGVKKVAPPIPARPQATLPTPLKPGTRTPPAVVVSPPPTTVPEPAPTEWHGNNTSVTHAGQVVLRNDRQWVRFWSQHHPHEAAPEVDFNRHTMIGVFAGPRPAEAFSIQIVNVRTLSNKIVVEYREQPPPPGTLAVNVTAYPYHLKAIPRTTLSVQFKQISL